MMQQNTQNKIWDLYISTFIIAKSKYIETVLQIIVAYHYGMIVNFLTKDL